MRLTRRGLVRGVGTALLIAGGSRRSPAAPMQTLRRVVATELSSVDPQRPTGSVTREIAAELFAGLTISGSDGRIGPGCAVDWTMSADGLRWRFRLRERLAWSDGTPLAARDFVTALRRFVTPEVGVAEASRLDALRNAREIRFGRLAPERLRVSAPDARTLQIELEQPDLELPARLSLAYCVPTHALERHGKDWARPDRIVGNGPYTLESWAPGAKIVRLRRNPRFHGAARVAIERVDWLTGYDEPTRLRLFRLGEAEITTIEDGGHLAAARRDLANQLRSDPSWSIGWIGINLARKPLDDPRIRRALSLAIDRPLLTTRVRGLGDQASESLLPPGLWDQPRPALPDHAAWLMPRRLTEARALMQQAGFAGTRRLAIGIGVPVPNPTLRKVFLAITAMWKQIGVDGELRPLDGRAYGVALNNGEFDVFSFGTYAPLPGATSLLDRFLSDASTNVFRYRSADFDRSFRLAEIQLDPDERRRYMAEADTRALRDLPAIPLYVLASNVLVSNRVRGWNTHPGVLHPSRFLALT